MSNRQIAAALTRARTKYNLSQAQVAREAGVSPAYVSAVESGHEKASEKLLRFYAEKFRLDFDELARASGRVPSDVKQHLVETPGAIAKVRSDMKKQPATK